MQHTYSAYSDRSCATLLVTATAFNTAGVSVSNPDNAGTFPNSISGAKYQAAAFATACTLSPDTTYFLVATATSGNVFYWHHTFQCIIGYAASKNRRCAVGLPRVDDQ